MEQVRVHAARPVHQSPPDAMTLEFVDERAGADERVHGFAVEPAFRGVAPPQRNGRPGGQVFGEASVEARGEAQPMPGHPQADRDPERPLRCDVDGVGTKPLDAREGAPGIARDTNLGVGRQRHRAVLMRTNHAHCRSRGLEVADQARQRVHHAVDLRLPRVGDECEPAGPPGRACSRGRSTVGRSCQRGTGPQEFVPAEIGGHTAFPAWSAALRGAAAPATAPRAARSPRAWTRAGSVGMWPRRPRDEAVKALQTVDDGAPARPHALQHAAGNVRAPSRHGSVQGVDTVRFGPHARDEQFRRDLLAGTGASPDAVRPLASGRLSPEKNPEVLLRCAADGRPRRSDGRVFSGPGGAHVHPIVPADEAPRIQQHVEKVATRASVESPDPAGLRQREREPR